MTTRILDINCAVSIPEDMALYEMSIERLWMNTLKALSAYQTYRRLKAVHVNSRNVIDFLISNEHFPRSLQYCLNEMESCLKAMPFSETVLNTVQDSKTKLFRLQSDNLEMSELHELLDLTQKDLGEINTALTKQYFHAKPEQQQSNAEMLQ